MAPLHRTVLFVSPNIKNRDQLAEAFRWSKGKNLLLRLGALTPDFLPSYATLSDKGLIPGDCEVRAAGGCGGAGGLWSREHLRAVLCHHVPH